MKIALFKSLERLNVFSLPALGPLGDVELHCLALLQALETACLDRREVHKNILAILTADEAIAFGVVEPLYCSLFCHVDTGVPFNQFTLERFGGIAGRLLAVEARAAHDRLGLTYITMVPVDHRISKVIAISKAISAPLAHPKIEERVLRSECFALSAADWTWCSGIPANGVYSCFLTSKTRQWPMRLRD